MLMRRWIVCLVLFGCPLIAVSQPPAKDAPPAVTQQLIADLREAQTLLPKINDLKTRERLELLLTRSELKALEIEKKLATMNLPPPIAAVTPEDFARFLKGVTAESFDSGKRTFVESNLGSRFFTSAQVREILAKFTFDDERSKAAILLYPRLTDPDNFFTALEVFTFDSSRRAVREKLKLK